MIKRKYILKTFYKTTLSNYIKTDKYLFKWFAKLNGYLNYIFDGYYYEVIEVVE